MHFTDIHFKVHTLNYANCTICTCTLSTLPPASHHCTLYTFQGGRGIIISDDEEITGIISIQVRIISIQVRIISKQVRIISIQVRIISIQVRIISIHFKIISLCNWRPIHCSRALIYRPIYEKHFAGLIWLAGNSLMQSGHYELTSKKGRPCWFLAHQFSILTM